MPLPHPSRITFRAVLVAAAVALPLAVLADDAGRRPLDHDSYDIWKRIESEQLSRNGDWLLYVVRPGKGDAELVVRQTRGTTTYTAPRPALARFSYDDQYVIYLQQPDPEAVKAAQKAKKPAAELPKATLAILQLATGKLNSIPRVRSYRMPAKAAGWIGFTLEAAAATASVTKSATQLEQTETNAATEAPSQTEASAEEANPPAGKAAPADAKKPKKQKAPGSTLVLRDLATGIEQHVPDVTTFVFDEAGSRVAWATSTADGTDEVVVQTLLDGRRQVILSGRGNYRSLTFDEAGQQLALLTDRDDYEAEQPSHAIYHWRVGQPQARLLVDTKTAGLPEGWWVPQQSGPGFSKDGQRLIFGTAMRPEAPQPDKEKDDEPQVKLDVWHWQDGFLQPMQLVRAQQERLRTYRAVVHLNSGKFVQLATREVPTVTVGNEDQGRFALGLADVPYRKLLSWDYPNYQDVYLIDVVDGRREKVLEKQQSRPRLSPEGHFLHWWDTATRKWMAMSVFERQPIDLSAAIRVPLQDELHDTPSPARPYGIAGWTSGDRAVILYDRYDLWLVDPRQPSAARCVTSGAGRRERVRYRYLNLDAELRHIPTDEPLMLSAFDERTKASGFSRISLNEPQAPQRLLMRDARISSLRKAADSDTVIFTRSSFRHFPDLWASDLTFRELSRMSRANPQQQSYRWGTSELVSWKSATGQSLDGLLLKPDNFDPARQYPLLVYFYERNSDNLHRYVAPAPARASINFSFYVSRGYLVFVPDIPYRTGYPGQSAYDAVVPGVERLIAEGFVNRQAIGVQGHSWGGYQVAYLVTRTNLFTAAEAGAPVSNMTSAYGGIRWSSGMSRMFQYERTQSRIGDNLWNARDKYLENSPLFAADKVATPLLILHNDKDGAVPWYQGIELFVALRRLSKPAWLINYNDEDHGLTQRHHQVDWSIRMQQFFDHYLKQAPAPTWLAKGIPAVDKGKTLGLEPAKD